MIVCFDWCMECSIWVRFGVLRVIAYVKSHLWDCYCLPSTVGELDFTGTLYTLNTLISQFPHFSQTSSPMTNPQNQTQISLIFNLSFSSSFSILPSIFCCGNRWPLEARASSSLMVSLLPVRTEFTPISPGRSEEPVPFSLGPLGPWLIYSPPMES